MGQHFYPCPTCYATQKVRAQSGEVVTIKDCDACAQTKAASLLSKEDYDQGIQEALDEFAGKKRR